jgi:predicted permease
MNHSLEAHGQLAQRRGSTDGERGKELTRQLHGTFQKTVLPFRAMQRPRQVGQKWGRLEPGMIDVLNLALPYFGLIFIGFACGKLKQIPDTALAWMNFFIVYVALPALFYRILAQTPLEQLAQVDFIFATTLATFWAFAVSFAIGMMIRHGNIGESTIAGLAGGYGNIGYMGPGLALATLGPQAAVPVALIFCFDTLLLFSLVPFLMALANPSQKSIGATAVDVVKRIVTHPLVIATAVGVASAAVHFQPPLALERLLQFLQNAAAPCALFTLGVTVALRPLKKMPWEVPFLVSVKLVLHPVLVFLLLSLFGIADQDWVYTAVLMAALPPALNVFVFARQYDTWVEQASGAVLVGTLISVVTLTTVMWTVKTHTLPPLLFR